MISLNICVTPRYKRGQARPELLDFARRPLELQEHRGCRVVVRGPLSRHFGAVCLVVASLIVGPREEVVVAHDAAFVGVERRGEEFSDLR